MFLTWLSPVEDGLVEMGHAPPLGNVEVEPLGQRLGGSLGGGVAPGAESGNWWPSRSKGR